MNPRLSVILPVYNAMPYLPDAVESILNQTYREFRLIIVNDGSTDDSGAYLRKLADSRIILINQENQGPSGARKAALGHCHTEFVALMDADDFSLPERFRLQIEYLDAHPDVVLVGTQIKFLIGKVLQSALPNPTEHEEIEARLLEGRASLCNSSLMFRLDATAAIDEYPDGLIGEDIDFCLSMCEQGRVANLDDALLQYRMHTAQTCLSKSKELAYSYRYAAHRAVIRRKGLSDPGLEEFLKNAPFLERLRWSIEAWELVQYRTGRILIASGKPVRGFFRLGLLALARPVSVFRRLTETLKRSHRRRTKSEHLALAQSD